MCHKLGGILCVIIMLFDAHSAMSGTLSVNPSIRIEERYDSNPDFRGDGRDFQGDFLTSITPKIEGIKDYRGNRLSGNYEVESRNYYREPGRDYLTHRANIGMNMGISSQYTFTMNESLIQTEDYLTAAESGIVTERSAIFANTASMSLARTISQQSSISMKISDRILQYDDPTRVDTRTDSGFLAWTYNRTTKNSFTPRYGYTKFSFGNGNSYDNHSLQLSFVERFSPETSIDIGGGAVYTPEINKRLDWTAYANFTKTFKSSSLNLGYSRAVNTSTLTQQLNISQRAYLSLGIPFGRSFNIAITGNMARNNSEPINTVDIDSYTAGINARWRPYTWMVVGAGYSYFQQQVGEGSLGVDLTRDQVFVNIAATPAGWRF